MKFSKIQNGNFVKLLQRKVFQEGKIVLKIVMGALMLMQF